MGQYFDAFIPGMCDDDLPALMGFMKRIDAAGSFDGDSGVFSFFVKNRIYHSSMDSSPYSQNDELSKLIKEFRATPLESYWQIEMFCRAEDEDHWTAIAHDGKQRKCCHDSTAEAIQALSEARTLRSEVDSINRDNVQLRGKFQMAVNEKVRKFIEEFTAQRVAEQGPLAVGRQ